MTKIITKPKELYGFVATPGVELMKLAFAGDDLVSISWKYGAESLRHTTEVIGAYVTAGSSTHLCRYLDRLGGNAMYSDTESVVNIQLRVESPLIETGKLGDITFELRPSESISKFVSGGRKNV